MPGFFKNLFGMFKKEDSTTSDTATKAAAANVSTESAVHSAKEASEKYKTSEQYDRNLYDSQKAKRKYKNSIFGNKQTIVDKNGNVLHKNQQAARNKYGDNKYTNHSSDVDHIVPLKTQHKYAKHNGLLNDSDIKEIANNSDNLQILSAHENRSKGSNEDADLKTKIKASMSLHKAYAKRSVENAAEIFHESGVNGAIAAGQMTVATSGITNIVALINGEKTVDEAVCDVAKDGVKSTATGYLIAGSTTTVAQAFSKSSNELVKLLTDANVSGKIIATVITTYDTVERYAKGEITTNQCMLELGEKGSVLATSGYSMMVGQAVIPIPVVGAAIGALVGASLTSGIYKSLTSCLQKNEIEYQEMQRVIDECNAIAEEERRYRAELEQYLEQYFKDYRYCFSTALSAIDSAFASGDVDGVISGANQITKKLGGNVYYENFDEFKDFLASDEVDVF